MIVRRMVALTCALPLVIPAAIQAQSDSGRVRQKPSVVTWLDAATLGVGVAGSIALMGADERIAHRLTRERQERDRYKTAADISGRFNEKSLFAAGLVTYGISKLVHAPRTTTDIAWHTTESILVASATATLARGILGRSRPFVSLDSNAYDYKPGKGFSQLAYRAYPSIHATSAFATAAALTAETARHSTGAAWVVGPLSYSLASLPGLARIYKDKHWASDVAMGAAVGAVSGWATVRYHHHRAGNTLDRIFIGVTPTVVAGRDLGLMWTGRF